MKLGGLWRVAESNEDLRRRLADPDLDDSQWATQEVPGHWRSVPGLESSDGPALYRRRFEAHGPDGASRAFVVFDGIFYQGDVWLDGEYLGDTEGYFFPHSFEVTERLKASDSHLLAVEVTCSRPADRTAKRNLTGVFQHWDCIDPDWNPGGIWAGVRIERTGSVRIGSLKVLCREANEERAVLELEAVMDRPEPGPVTVETTVAPEDPGAGPAEPAARHTQEQNLSAGDNTVKWRVTIDRPRLWWPRALGDQPLYRVHVTVSDGDNGVSDRRSVLTGLRQIRLRNFIATVNGERLFLKGANLGPARRDLAAAGPEDLKRDITLALDAGLDLLRVHAHISRPELYEAADRAGLLLWQDLPLQWGYGNIRRQAMRQARQAVNMLGHHPSIAVWCGHNEPMALDLAPGAAVTPGTVAQLAAAMVLPSWNKTGLDRSIRRALERADDSREVVAHSGVVPHPIWGTDSHFYFGWYHGAERDFPTVLARLPVLARFVSEFGAQAVPETAGFMDPEAWPDLDWDRLVGHHCLQKGIFDDRVPPADYGSFEEWKRATQEYQATVLRYHIETLRRLKYRPTGGFCLFMLADSQPAVTWSVVDHERVPKAAYQAVAEACRPVIVVADRPDPTYRPGDRIALGVHAVSDLRQPLGDAEVEAVLEWPSGRRVWRFAGDVDADRCVRIGRIQHTLPRECRAGPLQLNVRMRWPGGEVANRYTSRVEI
jgi:beta-mannosidase